MPTTRGSTAGPRRRRPIAALVGLVVLAVAVAMPTSTVSANSDGARVATLAGALGKPSNTALQLRGEPCRAPNQCEPIFYSNVLGAGSVQSGADAIDTWVRSTPGPKVVMGHSMGASAIYAWIRQHANDPTAPGPDELSFISIGNPERANTGRYVAVPAERWFWAGFTPNGVGLPANNPYEVTDVCRKWDGWCDWSNDWRASLGQNLLHADYTQVNLNDSNNQVRVEGNVTYIMNPTAGW